MSPSSGLLLVSPDSGDSGERERERESLLLVAENEILNTT